MKRYDFLVYFGKKAMLFFLSIFLLSVFVFYISRLAPGDPLLSYYGERAERLGPQEREWAEKRLGLNESVTVQYVRWLKNALRGDFGISYKYKMEVTEVIKGRIGNTLILGGSGFLLIFGLALLTGILCAWREDGILDRILCKVGTVVSCIPEFWLSLVLILIFSVNLRWLPSSGAGAAGAADDFCGRIRHLILPLTVIVAEHLWYYAYLIRNRLLEEMRADYVLLAKSKGLNKRRILFAHCLRNAVPSYISLMAVSVPHILGGTYIVETVFSYPGLGTLSYESARYKDYNLLMLLCILSGALVIFCSIAAKAINERMDPRTGNRNIAAGAEVQRR